MNDRFLQDDHREPEVESMARRIRTLADETRNLAESLRALRDATICLDNLSDRLELQRAVLPSRERVARPWLAPVSAGFVTGVAVTALTVWLQGDPDRPTSDPLDAVAPANRHSTLQ